MKNMSSIPFLLRRTKHLRNIWHMLDDGSWFWFSTLLSVLLLSCHTSGSLIINRFVRTCINFKIPWTNPKHIWICSLILKAQNVPILSVRLITWLLYWPHCCRSSGSDKRVNRVQRFWEPCSVLASQAALNAMANERGCRWSDSGSASALLLASLKMIFTCVWAEWML